MDLSLGGPLDTSERGALSQYLAPRMLVKTRYQNIFFSFISLQFINNTSFTFVDFFCIKDSNRKTESRSDCEKEDGSGDGNGLCEWFNKKREKHYTGRCRGRKSVRQQKERCS